MESVTDIATRHQWLTIDVYDDLNLSLIAESGQTFRMRWIGDLGWMIQTGDHVALARQITYDADVTPDVIEDPEGCRDLWRGSVDEGSWMDAPVKGVDAIYRTSGGEPNRIQISCSRTEWKNVWRKWFDMDRSYVKIRSEISERGKTIDPRDAMKINIMMTHGEGIRILRQDPWETLCTFIISQRRSIPSIKTSVRRLSEKWGHPIGNDRVVSLALSRFDDSSKINVNPDVISPVSFPNPRSLAIVPSETLNDVAGLGYRDVYVHDAAVRVADGDVNLNKLRSLDDESLLSELESFRGVGVKIASCTALFAYGRLGVAPVDVWIDRVIREDFSGRDALNDYGSYAGLVQQWAYYWALRNDAGQLDGEISKITDEASE